MALTESAVKQVFDEAVVLMHHPRPGLPTTGLQFDALKTDFNNRTKPTVPSVWLGDSAGQPMWDRMEEEDRVKLLTELTGLRDAFRQLLPSDTAETRSIMFDSRASNAAIWWLFGYSVILVVLTGGAAIWLWSSATQPGTKVHSSLTPSIILEQSEQLSNAARAAQDKRKEAIEKRVAASSNRNADVEPGPEPKPVALTRAAESAEEIANQAEAAMRVSANSTGLVLNAKTGPGEGLVLWMVIIFGAQGGTLRLVSSVVRYIGNRQLSRSWIAYYLAMPVQGALLAPIGYMLLRVVVLAPSAAGENGTAHLNLISIYAVAALTGLFANQAMVKLGDVVEEVFRTKEKR